MNFSEILKLIRAAEGLSQSKMAQHVDIPIKTLQAYEQQIFEPSLSNLQKIAKQFPEYSLWLLTGQTNPKGGQISPALKATNKQTAKAVFQT